MNEVKAFALMAAKDSYKNKLKFIVSISNHLDAEVGNEIIAKEAKKYKKLIKGIENL